MSEKIIYFEKPSQTTKEFVEKYQGALDEIHYWQEMSTEERKMSLQEATCFILATFKIDSNLILESPHLKLIQRAGIGIDNIDVATAMRRNVLVANTPGVNAISVAEMTIGLILNLYRKICFMNEQTHQGNWLMWEYRPFMHEMNGKVHGILGMGNVGREVAKRSKAFDTKIFYYDPFRLSPEQEAELGIEYAPFEQILKEADILSLHVPLLEETRNWIGEKELKMMKKTAILINVARGNIVDEQALAAALEKEEIAGAAIDTFSIEPFMSSNCLANCRNVILTPHIAGGTLDVLKEGIKRSFENLRRLERNENLIGEVK